MFFFKSIVGKFVFWSVILIVLVGITGVQAIWNNQAAFSGGTQDFTYWQGQYKTIAATLATTPDAKASAQGAAVVVQQYTIQQFPFILNDGTAQQRVDRCESCHIGVENPNMTAENIIKTVDHVDVAPAQIPDYLDKHPAMRDMVFTLGVHPGRGAYTTLTAQSIIKSTDNTDVDTDQVADYLTAHPKTMADVLTQLGLAAGTDAATAANASKIIYNNGVVKGDLPWAVVVGDSSDSAAHARAALDDHVVSAHPFATYGCTTCHYGSGRELVQHRAHGNSDFWLQPMLPSKYQEAACAQCHEKFDPKTFAAAYTPEMTTIARGEKLFKQNACWGCHKIEGYSKGNVGPELTLEGRIATYKTIEHQLWDPRYKVNNCVMPYFFSARVLVDKDGDKYVLTATGEKKSAGSIVPAEVQTDETRDSLRERDSGIPGTAGYIPDASRQSDVDALVTFITAQTGLNYTQDPSGRMTRLTAYNQSVPLTVPVTAEEGKLLFETSGCNACHYMGDPDHPKNGKGGATGPNLSWEGSRHSRQWLVAHYLNPQAFVPKSVMPIFAFSDSQRAALSLYDASRLPKGSKPVSQDQDMPTLAMQKDQIVDPQVRYMTR